MEHFLEGNAPLKYWYINSKKNLLFLEGNVHKHVQNAKLILMS